MKLLDDSMQRAWHFLNSTGDLVAKIIWNLIS